MPQTKLQYQIGITLKFLKTLKANASLPVEGEDKEYDKGMNGFLDQLPAGTQRPTTVGKLKKQLKGVRDLEVNDLAGAIAQMRLLLMRRKK
jgi:hypothetical protein